VFVEQGRRKKDISPSTCAGVNDVSCVSYPSIKSLRWFSPVSSTNKTDRHNIIEILLKVELNLITLTLTKSLSLRSCCCA
jgi:hypothetical protein